LSQQSTKPPYALTSHIKRGWELKANNTPLEDLLAAYAHVHGSEPQQLAWFTATHEGLGVTYTYGIHPNASLERPYDSMWKREYCGGGSVIVAYAEEPETRRIYVGVIWQRRKLHHPTQPVLGVPRGFSLPAEQLGISEPTTKEDRAQVHLRTALVELAEELFRGDITPDMIHQLGPPTNTNSADVDTSGDGEGTYFYRVELPWSYLVPNGQGNFALKSELEATEGSVEGIVRYQFLPLSEVLAMLDDPDNATAGCEFTEIAVGRLARYLQRR
jgi:hypothetical protein